MKVRSNNVNCISLLILFAVNSVLAQSVITKSVINSEIDYISIDVSNSFELSVDTTEGNGIIVEAVIDGEYKNDLLVDLRETRNTLFMDTKFRPNFKTPNDKLSTHKVISIALKIRLPAQKNVSIFGKACHVYAEGDYDNLKIILNDGRCILKNISGTAKVVTQSGNVSILAQKGKFKAVSKYGEITPNHVPVGDTLFDISSVTGNILIEKIEP